MKNELERKIVEIEEELAFFAKSRVEIEEFNKQRAKETGSEYYYTKDSYQERFEKVNYYSFIHSADYHYFVSRILFQLSAGSYSLFCAQQCIENYFKSYLLLSGIDRNDRVFDKHDLIVLVKKIREVPICHSFFKNPLLMEIVQRFNFNQWPRYPIPKSGPRVMVCFSDDVKYLDYFVFRMKEIIPIPEGYIDSIKRPGVFRGSGSNEFLNALFKLENINFFEE